MIDQPFPIILSLFLWMACGTIGEMHKNNYFMETYGKKASNTLFFALIGGPVVLVLSILQMWAWRKDDRCNSKC